MYDNTCPDNSQCHCEKWDAAQRCHKGVTEYSAKKGGRLNGIKCKPQLEEKYYITQLGETCREEWFDSHQFHFLFLAHKRQHFPAPLQLGWDPVVGFCQ